MDNDIEVLARLLGAKNEADRAISILIHRPATPGNIGEFVASKIFDIDLDKSGSRAGYDGEFRSGPLKGKTVNIKAYGRFDGLLDISEHPADYYLVLTGRPKSGQDLGWGVSFAFLFNYPELRSVLRTSGAKLGIATSVPKDLWDAAKIFPSRTESPYAMTSEQHRLLSMLTHGLLLDSGNVLYDYGEYRPDEQDDGSMTYWNPDAATPEEA